MFYTRGRPRSLNY